MPALVHQLHRLECDERSLLGGLGDDRVARRECRCDLAAEDGEREIPRADANENSAPAQPVAVLLSRQDPAGSSPARRAGAPRTRSSGRNRRPRALRPRHRRASCRPRGQEAQSIGLDCPRKDPPPARAPPRAPRRTCFPVSKARDGRFDRLRGDGRVCGCDGTHHRPLVGGRLHLVAPAGILLPSDERMRRRRSEGQSP